MLEATQPTCHDQLIKGVMRQGRGFVSSLCVPRGRAPRVGSRDAGQRRALLTLNVNGQDRHIDVMKQETLAMTLRYKLGLTGTKLGCDRSNAAPAPSGGRCARCSCSVLTHSVRGARS